VHNGRCPDHKKQHNPGSSQRKREAKERLLKSPGKSLSEPVGDKHTTGYRFINTMEQPADHSSESTEPSSSNHFALEEVLPLTIEAIVNSFSKAITSPATSSAAEPFNSARDPAASSLRSTLSLSDIHTVTQSSAPEMHFSATKSVDFSDNQSTQAGDA
jgi:hypothetical protein